ncbi:hypothetical protein OIU84_010550 [Salix udensis]|uniref:Uncharacterized protein n=1 Tax=Salix udensis TaxID=889485 RepID=A0AAD6JN17_9ROSI|nr:hypothetical protein OIU84_010550 [Salix udensis]
MKEYWGSLASILGVLAFCQSLLQVLIPPELRYATLKLFNRIFNMFTSYCYFDITEIDGVNTNELYNAVQLYLSSCVSISGSRLSLTRALNSSAITFGLTNNDTLFDTFNGVTVLWEHIVTQRQAQTFSWRPLPDEKRGFTLRIKKKDKSLILDSYLDYIMEKANDMRRKNQDRLLYTNSRGGSLDSRGHPWDPNNSSSIGRSYCDPEMRSGTGVSSGDEGGNSITLSGLLNFTDGLWSCCGSERIFVFTTNHIDKLDPALLRSGRMDMHVFMSYCSFPALKILLKNYLGSAESDLDEGVLKGLEEVVDKAEMTPADVSELLIKNRRSKDKAVLELLEALKSKAEMKLKSGGCVGEKNLNDVEEEEQEKRALESPKEGCDFEDSVKKEEEDEEKKIK